jgi:hypothetical protein
MDKLVEGLKKHFKQFNNEVIISALKANSMDLIETFKYLKDPFGKHNNYFSPVEDAMILNKSDVKDLSKSKGEGVVERRKEFLNIF